MSDYYKLLGIEKNASDEDIKKAYRQKAKDYHPDLHPNDKNCEQKFKEVNEAYEVLGDSIKKRNYDAPQSNSQQFHHNTSSAYGNSLNDIFINLGLGGFGFSTRRQKIAVRQDISHTISISIKDAFCGSNVRVEYNVRRACQSCNKNRQQTCKSCQGNGASNTQRGNFFESRICSECQGEGSKRSGCSLCSGAGYKTELLSVEFLIPKGAVNGTTLSIKDKGHEGVDGCGQLLVIIAVNSADKFVLDGETVRYTLEVNVLNLICGSIKTIELPDKRKISLTIPSGTQIDHIFTLKEEGLPLLNSTKRGNLMVQLKPFVPKLSREALELLKKEINE